MIAPRASERSERADGHGYERLDRVHRPGGRVHRVDRRLHRVHDGLQRNLVRVQHDLDRTGDQLDRAEEQRGNPGAGAVHLHKNVEEIGGIEHGE